MNKKGFTMVELLASLAIMLLLAIVVIPNISAMRQKTLKQTYDSRVKQVQVAAKEWAGDNLVSVPSNVSRDYSTQRYCDTDCVCISIDELIREGYLAGDKNEKKTLTNPITNEEMNDKLVCVRYDTNDINTREIISYIEGE